MASSPAGVSAAEGQSLEQIAENLGVGYGAVRARLLTSR